MSTDRPSVAIRAHRHGLVGRLLDEAVAAGVAEGRHPTVLDCGGGTGSFAVPLAGAGAAVTVVDSSADALATLVRRAAEAGVPRLVTAVQGDVESLDGLLAGGLGGFDLVLAHGILESVDHVPAAFAGIARAVAPGGVLSVLVDNPAAGILARVLAGELAAAVRELDVLDSAAPPADPAIAPPADPPVDPPVDLAQLRRLCADAGLVIEQVHGVGVFADLVPGAALELPGAREALAELETRCATRSPFVEIAGRVHVLARRPAHRAAAATSATAATAATATADAPIGRAGVGGA